MSFTEADALALLRRQVAKHGSQRALANALGIGEVALSQMLTGRRGITDQVLEGIGLKREVTIKQKAELNGLV